MSISDFKPVPGQNSQRVRKTTRYSSSKVEDPETPGNTREAGEDSSLFSSLLVLFPFSLGISEKTQRFWERSIKDDTEMGANFPGLDWT